MRIVVFKFIVIGLISLLGLNLFHHQIIRGGYYQALSERNRIRLIPIPATRGRIYDRNDVVLAGNRPSFDVYAVPDDFKKEYLDFLAHTLNLNQEKLNEKIKETRSAPFVPLLIKQDVDKETVFKLEELKPDLTGVFVQTQGIRYYPQQEIVSHIIGYIGKVNRQELASTKNSSYDLNDYIGRAGIEKVFDSHLRGINGGRQIEVNSRGEEIRVLAERAAQPGHDLKLTIDFRLQKKIYELIGERKAAVCILDLKNDEILALVSWPAFDPNIFILPAKSSERLKLLRDKSFPFLDRGVSTSYPPGSIFKLVTAVAALETGKITPYTTFQCNGVYRLNPRSRPFECWRKQGHGEINLFQAIERSCNIYFYNVGARVGERNLAIYARKLGLGQELDIELSNVATGLIPDAEWKKERFQDKWYKGETLNYAIGQGYVLVSPLQVLKLVATIAKDGEISNPHIVKREKEERLVKKVAVKETNIHFIKQAMLKVVESDFGTGQYARVDFTKMAGKTGTAQTPSGPPHAWFIGFFPYENPEVALVVFVEHGGQGGVTATALTKEVVNSWRELYVG